VEQRAVQVAGVWLMSARVELAKRRTRGRGKHQLAKCTNIGR